MGTRKKETRRTERLNALGESTIFCACGVFGHTLCEGECQEKYLERNNRDGKGHRCTAAYSMGELRRFL